MTNTLSLLGLDSSSFSSVIRPNDDFFRYVNGVWIDTYRLPDDKPCYGSFHKLIDEAEEHLRDILEDANSNVPLSKQLYRSYCDTDAIEAAGIEPIRDDLRAIDAVETKQAFTELLGSQLPSGGSMFFSLIVDCDPGNPEYNVIHIEQGGLGLPDEAYYREEHYEPIRQQYVLMVAQLLQAAGYGSDGNTSDSNNAGLAINDECQKAAQRFLEIETAIAQHHWDNVRTRDSHLTYNPTNWDDLCQMLEHVNLPAWVQSWQHSYDAGSNAVVQPVDLKQALQHTIVREPSFLQGFDTFYHQASVDDLVLWARVHTLISSASVLSSEFENIRFNFYGKVLSGTQALKARWKRAVDLVDGICGEEIGEEYVRRHFPQSSKDRMEQLVHNLIDAYHYAITNSSWLGQETKQQALEKLSKFTAKIGYPKKFRKYEGLHFSAEAGLADHLRAASRYSCGYEFGKVGKVVDKDEWFMTPQTVNAYYDPTKNVIVFPAAILQPPFFNPDADDAINYGAIGAVIGHEIGHGFDDQGSKYDGTGQLRDWWTAQDREQFELLTTKLIEQYNSFVPSQLLDLYSSTPDKAPHVNGQLTVGENIGDLGGVNIALIAYAFALDADVRQEAQAGNVEAIKRTLTTKTSLIEGFSGLQRFFLSYAYVWREKTRNELVEQLLQIDPHSPGQFRTNGIVSNVDLFYDAFNVQPDDGMWLDPKQRVRIW